MANQHTKAAQAAAAPADAAPMPPSGPEVQEYTPIPFGAAVEAPQVLISEALPSNGPCPDPAPYIRDVVTGQRQDGTPIVERRFTLETAKQYLLDCPKVPVVVPPDTLDELQNPSGNWLIPVTWKSVRWWVRKCRPDSVPIPIAEILGYKAEPLRTTQAKQKSIYVTEIADGGRGPEIKMTGAM